MNDWIPNLNERGPVWRTCFSERVRTQMFCQALMGWEIWKGHQTVVLSKHRFFVETAYRWVTGLRCQATVQMTARQTPHIRLTHSTAEWYGPSLCYQQQGQHYFKTLHCRMCFLFFNGTIKNQLFVISFICVLTNNGACFILHQQGLTVALPFLLYSFLLVFFFFLTLT